MNSITRKPAIIVLANNRPSYPNAVFPARAHDARVNEVLVERDLSVTCSFRGAATGVGVVTSKAPQCCHVTEVLRTK